MAKVSLKRVVNLTSHQAFAIASDVAAYKDFLPLVSKSALRGAVTEQGHEKHFAADLMIAVEKLGMREGFTSQVVVDSEKHTVTAISKDGPMKDLRAVWTIKHIDGSRSSVAIEIDYQFKSFLLQMAAGGMMDYAINKVMTAFEERGRQLFPLSGLTNI